MSYTIIFMKLVLVTFNILFVIVGLGLMVSGTWAVLNISTFLNALEFAFSEDMIDNEIYENIKLTKFAGYFFIGIGLLIFSVTFLGCCSVVTESYCMLVLYGFVVSGLFLLQVSCLFVFLIFGESVSPLIFGKLTTKFSQNYRGSLGMADKLNLSEFSRIVDMIQVKYTCCGVNGYEDFAHVNTSKAWHRYGRFYVDPDGGNHTGNEVGIPVACCKFSLTDFSKTSSFLQLHKYMEDAKCPITPISDLNRIGCMTKFSSFLTRNTLLTILIPILVASFEVVCVILAGALAHDLKHADS